VFWKNYVIVVICFYHIFWQLSRNCKNPKKIDYDSAIMILLQYLKSTINGNKYLIGYSDSDWEVMSRIED